MLTLPEASDGLLLELRDMKAVQGALNLVWRDTPRQENSGQRSRTLVAILLAFMKALEVGEYEERICSLEQAVSQQPHLRGGRA